MEKMSQTSISLLGRALRIVKVHSEAGSFPGTNGRVRFDPGALEIAVGMV